MLLAVGHIYHGSYARQQSVLIRHLYLSGRISGDEKQLDALFDPVVGTYRVPTLAADNVEKSVVKSSPHRSVEHLEEFCSYLRLNAS